MKSPLIPADFELAAATLRVPVAAIRAFAEVESRGAGFLPDDRPVILFERHVFKKQLAPAFAANLEKSRPDICNGKPGGYQGGAKEWQRLDDAVQINRQAALASASWGAFQVMGFNWARLGYTSVQDLVNAMYKSSAAQLDAFVRFIQSDDKLHKALQAQDWATCARLYNGSNYKINNYDTKLAAAFARYS